MSEGPSVVQLKPPRSEELAEIFDGYAARAREGDIVGYSVLLIRPGGKYDSAGWQAQGVDAFQEIGMLWSIMMETWAGTRRD